MVSMVQQVACSDPSFPPASVCVLSHPQQLLVCPTHYRSHLPHSHTSLNTKCSVLMGNSQELGQSVTHNLLEACSFHYIIIHEHRSLSMSYIPLHSWQRQEKDFRQVLNINHLLTDSIPLYMISETHLTFVPASPQWLVSSSGCLGYFSWLLSATPFSYFSAYKYHSRVQFHPRYSPCYHLSEDFPSDFYQVLEQSRVPASSVKQRVFKALTVLGLSTRTPLVLLDKCAVG